jgi:ubiquinone/menaquinone biosynthesis C-methylase UbiE
MITEENPFEESEIAQQWINSVEGEKGGMRDLEIYPLIRKWLEEVKPVTVVDIGAGQGICSRLVDPEIRYLGIEPSEPLVQRAKEKYPAASRDFLVGNAYALPVEDGVADAAFSVNVWFHLENLTTAARELARILKPAGQFLIITAHPAAYTLWESLYESFEKDGHKLMGTNVKVPVNPLSRNTLYEHSLRELEDSFAQAGLELATRDSLGNFKETSSDIFIAFEGSKAS